MKEKILQLTINGIINHPKYGLLEYIGVDEYYGERTLKFREVESGQHNYLKPSEVKDFITLTDPEDE